MNSAIRLILWLFVTLTTLPAQSQSCSYFGNFRASPTLPSTLYVRTNYAVGDPVYATNVSADFTCTGSTGTGVIFGPPTIPSTPVAVTGTTGLQYIAPGGAGGASSGSITVTSGSCSGAVKGNGKTYISFNGSSVTCSGTTTVNLMFIANSAAPTGTIPVSLPVGGGSFSPGWLSASACSSATCPGNSFTALLGLAATASIPLQALATTCTFNSSSLSAILPTVSNNSSTFPGLGTLVGSTPVPLNIICSSANSAANVNFTLTFTPAIDSSGASSGAIMTSTGSATGVGIAFSDTAGNRIVSGAPIAISTSGIQARTYSNLLTASYIQTGASVVAGSVTGSATFFLQYY